MSTLDAFEYALTRKALRQIKAEAWDKGWRAHQNYLAAVSVWNATEGAETPEALHARNPYRPDLHTNGGVA